MHRTATAVRSEEVVYALYIRTTFHAVFTVLEYRSTLVDWHLLYYYHLTNGKGLKLVPIVVWRHPFCHISTVGLFVLLTPYFFSRSLSLSTMCLHVKSSQIQYVTKTGEVESRIKLYRFFLFKTLHKKNLNNKICSPAMSTDHAFAIFTPLSI